MTTPRSVGPLHQANRPREQPQSKFAIPIKEAVQIFLLLAGVVGLLIDTGIMWGAGWVILEICLMSITLGLILGIEKR